MTEVTQVPVVKSARPDCRAPTAQSSANELSSINVRDLFLATQACVRLLICWHTKTALGHQHICVRVHTAFGFRLSFGWLYGFSFVFCRTETGSTLIGFRQALPAIFSLFPPLPIFSLSRDYDIFYAAWLSPWRGAVLRRSGSFSRYDLVGAAGGAKHCLQNTT